MARCKSDLTDKLNRCQPLKIRLWSGIGMFNGDNFERWKECTPTFLGEDTGWVVRTVGGCTVGEYGGGGALGA